MSEKNLAPALEHTDALIIGTGFSGLRALIELKKMGLTVTTLEAGTDVGGTWYWNRYPGARTDSQSWTYCFPFLELADKWEWTERYPGQPEVQRYLSFVTDYFDLRPLIRFGQTVTAASYDELANLWTVTTADGGQFTCTYLLPAVGPLSIPLDPKFKGMENFKGESYSTGRWPKEPVDFTGKRVAVIGTGASGIQTIPLVAEVAEHLTVFQRTPNYVMPSQNFDLDEKFQQVLKTELPQEWEKAQNHFFGFPLVPSGRTFESVTDEERERIFEEGWKKGGFHFVFETFDDIVYDQRSNDAAADFIRRKIKETVKDPEVAELLTPRNHPYVAKRPPSGTNYYETFNRENVTLVDIKSDPIELMTESGLRTRDGKEYEFDAVVFATGFDAVTGALDRIAITGKGGVKLTDQWVNGVETNLSIGVPNFPNMFMLFGPQVSYANAPVVTESLAGWLRDAIEHMRANGYDRVECTEGSASNWSTAVDEVFNQTLLREGESVGSWYLGANVPGKPRRVLFYFGGADNFDTLLKQNVQQNFEGFEFTRQSLTATN